MEKTSNKLPLYFVIRRATSAAHRATFDKLLDLLKNNPNGAKAIIKALIFYQYSNINSSLISEYNDSYNLIAITIDHQIDDIAAVEWEEFAQYKVRGKWSEAFINLLKGFDSSGTSLLQPYRLSRIINIAITEIVCEIPEISNFLIISNIDVPNVITSTKLLNLLENRPEVGKAIIKIFILSWYHRTYKNNSTLYCSSLTLGQRSEAHELVGLNNIASVSMQDSNFLVNQIPDFSSLLNYYQVTDISHENLSIFSGNISLDSVPLLLRNILLIPTKGNFHYYVGGDVLRTLISSAYSELYHELLTLNEEIAVKEFLNFLRIKNISFTI